MGPASVCVLGAGVIGLSCALQTLQKVPNVEVTIIAEKFNEDTTSDGAAGLWEPYQLEDTPASSINAWGGETLTYFQHLFQSTQAPAVGVQRLTAYSLYTEPADDPMWHELAPDYRHLMPEELAHFNVSKAGPLLACCFIYTRYEDPAVPMPDKLSGVFKAATTPLLCIAAPRMRNGLWMQANFVFGYCYTTVTCDQRTYLPWLFKRALEAGATIKQRRISSLFELKDYDVVINCTGLGARALCNDDSLLPIRGQVSLPKFCPGNSCMTFLPP